MSEKLKRVLKQDSYRRYGKVSLVEPVNSGFIVLAAEVDSRPAFLPSSRAKRGLVSECKQQCAALAQRADILEAVTFKAVLIPPGKGAFLKARPQIHTAKFDITILIETDSVETAKRLRQEASFLALEKCIRDAAQETCLVTARNVRRIGSVDHKRNGLFLFNYFYADDAAQNLAVWDYTAGWFQQETGLDNSTLLLPLEGEDTQYTILNHCRWDRLLDVLPSLLFKLSFRHYVETNFDANHVAPIPILYHKA